MASKTIIYPPPVVISGNEILLWVEVSDAYNSAGSITKGELTIDTFHEAGNTLVFTWNGITVTFTCVANYTGVTGTYPLRTTESLSIWAEKVLFAILTSYLITNDFSVKGSWLSDHYHIEFLAYELNPIYNLIIEANVTTACVTVNGSFIPADLYTNYKLRLQLMLYTDMFAKYRSPVNIPFIYSGNDASLQYDIRRLLYTDITGHFTLPETSIRNTHDIMQKYYLQLSFLADNITAESLPVDHYIYVLPGKMSDTKEKALNTQNSSVYADLVSSKRFLTFSPLIKDTDIYAPEKLYFLFLAACATATLKITERFRADAAETRTLETFNAAAFTLHEFSVGFQTIKQADYGTKVPTEYDIWIENGSGGLLSERRTFQIDYAYQRMARYFMFKNSFGVYELFRSIGDAVKSNKIEKDYYDRVVHGMTDKDQTRKPIDIQHTYSMKISSGYIPYPWNFYWIYEFLGSDDVYWLKNDRAYAIQVENSDTDPSKTDLDNLHDFDFLVTLDDMDDSFFQEFLPGSELPILGDFDNDFSEDLNV